MKIVAKTTKGTEYVYSARTAHKVPEAHAQKVCDILNQYRYKLHDENETWFVYDVGHYDIAFDYASFARFTYGKNGVVKERLS